MKVGSFSVYECYRILKNNYIIHTLQGVFRKFGVVIGDWVILSIIEFFIGVFLIFTTCTFVGTFSILKNWFVKSNTMEAKSAMVANLTAVT